MTAPLNHRQSTGITLTFVTNNIRGRAQHFDTDSLNEALHAFVDAGFNESPGEDGRPRMPEKWVFAVVVERDDVFERDELIDRFHDIADIEQARARR